MEFKFGDMVRYSPLHSVYTSPELDDCIGFVAARDGLSDLDCCVYVKFIPALSSKQGLDRVEHKGYMCMKENLIKIASPSE